MVLARQSVDDINLGTRPPEPPEKRARSSSPVKKRRPTQDWTSLTRSADGSLDRLFSTTSLSHDQLMRFSNSDISERLHISKAGYAIPIPFQIQFPPRLTKSASSPLLSKDSMGLGALPRLVFTGLSYEPVTSNMAVSPALEQGFPIPRPLSPEKPPSVITSRKKVSAFVQKTSSDQQDQLSMIEETYNSGDSRSSSYHSKKLPSVPSPILQSQALSPVPTPQTHKAHTSQVGSTKSPTTTSTTVGIKNSNNLTREYWAPGDLNTAVQQNKFSHLPEERKLKSNNAIDAFQVQMPQMRQLDTVPLSANTSSGTHRILRPNRLSGIAVFQHNFCTDTSPRLKIDRREFSDASKVSSVSSLNSVADNLNFNHVYMLSPNSKGDVRVSKHLVDSMLESKPRNRNPMPLSQLTPTPASLPLPVNKNMDDSLAKASGNSSQHKLKMSGSESQYKHAKQGSDSKECNKQKKVHSHDDELHPESASKLSYVVNLKSEPEETPGISAPDDNVGAGIGFHFPNNDSNATNSNEVKSKMRIQRHRTRGSARSSILSGGKIEIPDLDDLIWKNGASGNQLLAGEGQTEPLQIPGLGAKAHLKTVLRDRSFDSDSDSSFNSQFSKLQSQSEAEKNPLPVKSRETISSASSPVRHSRHRSMYNIDFDYESITSPQKSHNRSKSNAYVDSLSGSFAEIRLANSPRQHRRANTKRPDSLMASFRIPEKEELTGNFENLDIKVNEPPKRVSYAIDFKARDANPLESPTFSSLVVSQDYYLSLKKRQYSPSHASSGQYTPKLSEGTSSFQSSKTGRGTESTAPTENDNVVIDLTKEKYNVCVVNRNDSVISYRSTIEKTKDGKNVEVVLVDEDEDQNDRGAREERDDLLSIYSTYMTSWDDRGKVHHPRHSTEAFSAGLSREPSTRSDNSEVSDVLTQSWTASSESNFHVKSIASIRREQAYQTNPVYKTKPHGDALLRKGTTSRKPLNARQDASYFDYSSKDAYDFNSYMRQQSQR